jgi:broad specificity phosphatase PhoE
MSETSDRVAPSTVQATEQSTPLRIVTLYLVRHGQTTFNVEHRLPGQMPGVLLSDEGRRQAMSLAESLRDLPLTTIITSPLERARDTATIVRGQHDIPIIEDPRLMDTDVGPWAGQTVAELDKIDPRWKAFLRHPTQPPEGIEGWYSVLERVVAAAETARHDQSLGDHIMLVAHADVIKLLIVHYLHLPIEGTPWLWVTNASVTSLTFTGDRGPELKALNWTPSPDWLRPSPPKVEVQVSTDPVSEQP